MIAHVSEVFEITSEATSKASGATKVLTEVRVMQRVPLVIRLLKATFDWEGYLTWWDKTRMLFTEVILCLTYSLNFHWCLNQPDSEVGHEGQPPAPASKYDERKQVSCQFDPTAHDEVQVAEWRVVSGSKWFCLDNTSFCFSTLTDLQIDWGRSRWCHSRRWTQKTTPQTGRSLDFCNRNSYGVEYHIQQ